MRICTRRAIVALVTLAAITFAACSSDDSNSSSSDGSDRTTAAAAGEATSTTDGPRTRVASSDGTLVLETTSARADMVSGGDVLVTLSGSAAGDATVTRDDTDVSDVFALDGDVRRGVVDGLDNGEHTITATAGDTSVEVAVTDHPANGPIFSGPHLEPWACTTEAAGLGAATDEDCSAPTKMTWSYVTTSGAVKPLATSGERPDDLATTEIDGKTVPFVIRTERSVINRGIATIWVLDPGAGSPDATDEGSNPAPGAWDDSSWNRRLVFRFGGGCGTQFSQGSNLAVEIDPDLLSQGYAVATNTLDTFQTSCNDVLSAETMMMTREHFVERYGVPDFTIGDGGSGGAIQQLLIGSNYPGLLDAISAAVPFPDAVSISGGVTDCGLLINYFESETGSALTEDQQKAITGHASMGTCGMWKRLFLAAIDPSIGCDGSLADQVYDAETNPDGVRCTLQDISVNILGRDPETGFARRPLDNTGIQYGLGALEDGALSVDEFLDLNEKVGGYDIDGTIQAGRTTAGEDDVKAAYETGRVTGAGPLLDVPIILRNIYTDELGDIHTRVWPFAIRERLKQDGVDDPNLLLWTGPARGDLIGSLTGAIGNANAPIKVLDEWLTTGKKPADAKNQCGLPDETVLTGGWELYDEPGPCRDAFPVHSDSRFVAGQSLRGDIVKCQLQPVDPAGYSVKFSERQVGRLRAIFPDGVCDWTKPGIGQVEPTQTWRSYGT